MSPTVRLIEPFPQAYDWGKLGMSSMVAKLIQAGYRTSIDSGKPYAELWMGDHPNGPCGVLDDGTSHPIGEILNSYSMGSLPFLFKVLSVRKALSIQSHPDAALAQKLHAEFPDIYKDPNPKPELAVALTPFRALFGFRPVEEIVLMFDSLPDLLRVIPFASVARLRASLTVQSSKEQDSALKEAYSFLMHSSSQDVEATINAVIATGRRIQGSLVSTAVALAEELNRQFPGGDVGVLSVFFLNIVDLEPGQCIFMGPNVPHAYVSGDLIECMTCSDNVIRGGLTPKFKDVKTLLASLDFTCTVPSLLQPELVDGLFPCWSLPDVPFAVTRYQLSEKSVNIHSSPCGPSICLFMEGSGKIGDFEFKSGQCVLLAPNEFYTLDCSSSHVDMFLAFTPDLGRE